MKKLTVANKVSLGVMAVIVCVIVACNIACTMLFELITGFFHGSGIEFTGEATQQALAVSDELCREITGEGIVLLENKDDTLPLTKSDISAVNIFGWRSINAGWIGGASGSVNANNKTTKEKVVTLLQAMEESGFEYNQDLTSMYEKFCNVGDGKALEDGESFFTLKEPTKDYYTQQLIDDAKSFSDIAFVVFGRQGGEGQDLPLNKQLKYKNETDTTRSYLDISTEEEDLLDIVTTNFDRVIVIINSVSMMNCEFLDRYENIDAALWCGGTGQSGTTSLLRVLRGKITPSGKLPDTLPYNLADDPAFVNVGSQSSSHITYAENIYVGYRWWETADAEGYWDNRTRDVKVLNESGSTSDLHTKGYEAVVQYPFGYGLSYTQFEWQVESWTEETTITDKSEISVEVTVTNIGDRKGKDVVQLYVTPPYTDGGIEKSDVVLAAYAKTQQILPGESETVTLTFSAYDIASYDAYDKNNNGHSGYELEAGDYIVSLRTDAHTVAFCPEAEHTYKVGGNGIIWKTDPVTGNPVENRFTGDTAYAGVSIDGSNTEGGAVNYLSRAKNFENAAALVHYGNRSGSNIGAASSYVYDGRTFDEMPELGDGSVGPLTLYKTKDGSALNHDNLKSGEGLEINHELMMELGGDYDSKKWDELLNQMTYAEMEDLTMLGGYRTKEILSIGKKYFLDNDGGSGLNRHINEGDNNTSYDSSKRSTWTLFPSINLLAASWNDMLAYSYGLAIANEGLNTSIDGWYSPSCNLHRSPFCGRVAEYPSEDPLLSGRITAYQAKGALANGMYVYIKHFAVNENESGRTGLYTWLTEQSLRELYLKPFEIVVKEGKANGIMTSFNRLGATWTGGNYALCPDVLRNEWGFRGATITDYYAGAGYMPPKQAIYAGGDLLLTGTGLKPGSNLSSSNPTDVNLMRLACKNILFMKASAYYTAQTHDSSEDYVTVNPGIVIKRDAPFPTWIFMLVGLDVITVAGIALWCWSIFRTKKKKVAAGGPDGGTDGGPDGAEEVFAMSESAASSAAPEEETPAEDFAEGEATVSENEAEAPEEVEKVSDDAAENAAEPADELTAEPATEDVAENAAEPAEEPAAEPADEPAEKEAAVAAVIAAEPAEEPAADNAASDKPQPSEMPAQPAAQPESAVADRELMKKLEEISAENAQLKGETEELRREVTRINRCLDYEVSSINYKLSRLQDMLTMLIDKMRGGKK